VGDVVEVGDHEQATGARVNDVVYALTERAARGDNVQGSEKAGILTFGKLVELIPRQRRHPLKDGKKRSGMRSG
jgi:hypothetical protein